MRTLFLLPLLLIVLSLGPARAVASHLADNATPVPAITPIPGWPGGSTPYIGRYHLKASNNKKLATRGQLTIFMRTYKAGVPPVISGVLALRTKTRSNIFYLTAFTHTVIQTVAAVNLGSFAGPVIGRFLLARVKGKTLLVVFKVHGTRQSNFKFVKFSNNPQP